MVLAPAADFKSIQPEAAEAIARFAAILRSINDGIVMREATLPRNAMVTHADDSHSLTRLREVVARAANLLPIPGPVTAFAFLNTLQALEDLPFDEGMRRGASLYGAQPYLSKERYREHLASGRIRLDDLGEMLRRDLGRRADEPIASLTTRLQLRLAMLQFPIKSGPDSELRWFVAETDALQKMRDEVPPQGSRTVPQGNASLGDARPADLRGKARQAKRSSRSACHCRFVGVVRRVVHRAMERRDVGIAFDAGSMACLP